MSEAALLRYQNGLEVSVNACSWGDCVEVQVLTRDGQKIIQSRNGRGHILPLGWLEPLSDSVAAGEIFDHRSFERFFEQMGRTAGMSGAAKRRQAIVLSTPAADQLPIAIVARGEKPSVLNEYITRTKDLLNGVADRIRPQIVAGESMALAY